MFEALKEFISVGKNYQLWYELSVSKLRIRFIRTFLGPVWELLGTLIFLIFISIVWSKLWEKTFLDFFCYLYLGYLIWKSMSGIIGEATYLFSETYGRVFQNIYISPFVFCFVNAFKNLIIFLFNIPIIIIVLFLSNNLYLNSIFLVFLYIPLFFISSVCVSYICAVLCLKYRDIQFSIMVILQLLFFVTPVIWETSQLSDKVNRFIIEPNAFYHFIEFFRSSLLNGYVNSLSFLFVVISTLILFLITIFIHKNIKNKIVYWIT